MKLIKLRISNFRSIGGDSENPGVEIDLENTNIISLIGKNNVGKSSILEAYEYFTQSRCIAKECDFHMKAKSEIMIEGWIKAETEEDQEHVAIKGALNGEKVAKFRKIWSNKDSPSSKETFSIEEKKWKKGGAGGFDTLLQNACPEPIWLKGLDSVEIVLDNVKKLIKEKVIDRAKDFERFERIKAELEELRKEIINDDYSQKVESTLSSLMQETFPNISINLFGKEKEDLGKKLSTFVEADINFVNETTCSVGMENHGHGVRRQFLFNTLRGLNEVFKELEKTKAKRNTDIIDGLEVNKAETNKSKLLLIEEPELFLHPQSVRAFAEIIYDLAENSEFQVMTATHSPIMVDLSREHSTLIRVQMNEGITEVHQVKDSVFEGEEKEKLKMLNRFNPHVCEAFFADHVILVEGDTEAIIYRELLNRLVEEGEIKFNEKPLVVNCGSKMNIPSFQKVLRHFDIDYFVIHDLDDTYNKNHKKNAAWKLNEKIYEEIEYGVEKGAKKARRFIMERNFESAHNYEYTTSLGKPYSAFKLVQSWDIADKTIPAIKAIDYCLNYKEANEKFDQNWVQERESSIPL